MSSLLKNIEFLNAKKLFKLKRILRFLTISITNLKTVLYMSKIVEVKALVDGGKASAGPPLGSTLGPLRVNVKDVIAQINEKTKEFANMKVPVVVKVDTEKRTFEIEVKTPQTSVLLIKEAGAAKGSGTAGTDYVGNVEFASVVKVAKMKGDSMFSTSFKNAVKEVVGTCLSCGITIEGKNAKEIFKEIDEGKFDSLIVN